MKKIQLERFGECGWHFTIEERTEYRTDKYGDGLWEFCNTGSWFSDGTPEKAFKQITGTCQFSLPKDRKAAYSKIYRTFVK